MHSAAASLRDYAAFDQAIGGRWERDRSWHPPFGDARVHLVGNHVIREGLDDFTVADERYTALHLTEVIEPIAEHEAAHPTCPECGSDRVQQLFRSVSVQTSKKS
jgi:hypothetical protein